MAEAGAPTARRRCGPPLSRPALLLLVLALVSPLCRLAASLAAAHMVQHVLIVGGGAAAPGHEPRA